MHSRLAKWVVVALLVTVTGGHWAFLQTAAWVRMTIDYSQKDGLSVALQKTFDGRHPCNICRLISTEKKSEQKKQTQKFETKLDFFFNAKMIALYPPAFPSVCVSLESPNSRIERPPAPPPRLLHG